MEQRYTHPKILLSKLLKINPSDVSPTASLGTTNGWDSFMHLELMLECEVVYGLEISSENVEKCRSLRGIICLLEEKYK